MVGRVGREHVGIDKATLQTPVPNYRVVEWHYGVDGEMYAESVTTTYSTITGSVSPRSMVGVNRPQYMLGANNIPPVINSEGRLTNPLEQLSASYDSDQIFQTLEPVHHHASEGDMLEVMLPGGEVVSATLVRQATGKIIPLVMSKHIK